MRLKRRLCPYRVLLKFSWVPPSTVDRSQTDGQRTNGQHFQEMYMVILKQHLSCLDRDCNAKLFTWIHS